MDYNQLSAYGNNPEYYYQQLPQVSVPQYYLAQYSNQYPAAYPAANDQVAEKRTLKSWFDFSDKNYLKGLFIGAGAAVVLGHPVVRKKIISGAVSTWDAVTCGFEELKEQIEDIRAEKNGNEN